MDTFQGRKECICEVLDIIEKNIDEFRNYPSYFTNMFMSLKLSILYLLKNDNLKTAISQTSILMERFKIEHGFNNPNVDPISLPKIFDFLAESELGNIKIA